MQVFPQTHFSQNTSRWMLQVMSGDQVMSGEYREEFNTF